MNTDQEKIAKFIKDIRKKHHLTQKQFAEKYGVTYQAVSKWENARNMPDVTLMKQICKDFDISLEELFEGEYKKNDNKKRNATIILFIIIALCILTIMIVKISKKENDFQFKTLSTECNNFNISGNISYSETKSAIYITNIKYCGGDDKEEYKQIECILYESNDNKEIKISSFKSNREKMKLEEFLKDVTLSIDNYEKTCKEFKEGSLYLSINAKDYNDKIITYKIPLKLDTCTK